MDVRSAALEENVGQRLGERSSPRDRDEMRLAASVRYVDQVAVGEAFRFLQYRTGNSGLLMPGQLTDSLVGGGGEFGHRGTEARQRVGLNSFDEPHQDVVEDFDLL